MPKITPLTTVNFESEVLKNQALLVLVDFYTDECAPCEGLAIILAETKEDYNDTLKFKSMFVSTEEYDVSAFPTAVLFKGGNEIKRIIGGRFESELREELGYIL